MIQKAPQTPKSSNGRGKAASSAKKEKKPASAAKKAITPQVREKRKSTRFQSDTAALRKQVLAALDELKARDVVEIDVREKASFADLLILASGTSTRHVKSIADEVVRFAKRHGTMPLGVEGQREAEWVLVDLGDIVVHVMLPRVREFYGLERLWTLGTEAAEYALAEARPAMG